jgi:hypothetical protein
LLQNSWLSNIKNNKNNICFQGRYLAEMVYELMKELKETKYINAEYRVSIYGRLY